MKSVKSSEFESALPTDDELFAQAQEQEAVEKASKKRDPLEDIVAALYGIDGAPDILQLEQWKNIHGQFHVSSILADDNLYIWKTLKRAEYKSIAASGALKDDSLFADAIISKCLLYPKPTKEWFIQQDAGTIPSLQKQIMFKSGFVSEEMALSLINTV